MAFDLFIFDFDGTLADSGPWMAEALNHAAARFGFRQVGHAELEAGEYYVAALRALVSPSGGPNLAAVSSVTDMIDAYYPGTNDQTAARAIKDCGGDKPSAFAVFRLIASSYLVGACTGSSLGLAPRKTRST